MGEEIRKQMNVENDGDNPEEIKQDVIEYRHFDTCKSRITYITQVSIRFILRLLATVIAIPVLYIVCLIQLLIMTILWFLGAGLLIPVLLLLALVMMIKNLMMLIVSLNDYLVECIGKIKDFIKK